MSLIKQTYWEELYGPSSEDQQLYECWVSQQEQQERREAVLSYLNFMKEKLEQDDPTWEEELLDFYSPLIMED